MEANKCEMTTAVAIAELMSTWNDVMAKVEQTWPEANAASVYVITSAIIRKELNI